jgi:O-antigen/teichoic acid export membrane protein
VSSEKLGRASGARSRILKGVGANWLSFGVTLVFRLLIVRLYYEFWGQPLFGEWTLLTDAVMFLSAGDLMIGTSMGSAMTMLAAQGKTSEANRLFRSGTLLIFGLALLLGLAGFVGVQAFELTRVLGIGIFTETESKSIVTGFVALACVSFVGGPLQAAYLAGGHYARGIALDAAVRALEVAVYAAVILGRADPLLLAPFLVVLRSVSYVLMFRDVKSKTEWLKLGWQGARVAALKPILGPTLSLTVMSLGQTLSLQGFNLLVGIRMSPYDVAQFAPMRTLVRSVVQATTALSRSVWAEVSAAIARGDYEQARRFHRRSFQITLYFGGLLMTAMLVFGPWLFSFWTGERRFDARTLALLAVGAFFVGLWSIHQTVSLSINRTSGVAAAFMASSLAGLALANVWVATLGTTGAALGLLVGELVMLVSTGALALRITRDTPRAFLAAVVVPPFGWVKRA